MSALTNVQVIKDASGSPAFVVIPYDDYLAMRREEPTIPHAVIQAVVDGATPIRAWREYMDLSQADVAARLGISQSAYSQQEASEKLRGSTLKKIAIALGVEPEQLEI
ncbi:MULTISPECIES: helix-turn-helix domain-containing protein [Chromobacterium]|uniref:Helix-turn-helix transcriptional regulator n=1 Tax=Chromobacterium phragmitis TaxID=2202141 RepID=A0ABV0J2E3_9NEIS|nr:helix-turn-helix transcriptional regulator [Chromobacterium sp. ASV23]